MADGPFPEHYEPWESPVINPLHPQETNPALWDLEKDAKGATHAFPLVGTTYRVSEHWQTGAMTRNLPWLAEMQPEMFVEMSPQLAAERGIANGEYGDRRVGPRRDRGRGHGDAALPAVHRPGPDRARGRHALSLGLHRPGRRAAAPTS